MRSTRFTRLLALAIVLLAIPAASFAGIFVSITVAPPPLPVYVQPVCPQPGYMWTPGYWAWSDEGYYWVPGTWVPAPAPGLLWTPGYWGWSGGIYRWNAGYWGPHVGFYGGVNYGFGYGGVGFVGGEWRGGGFFYNSAVMNVGGAHITNVYVNRTVIVNNTTVNRVSFNGGVGGINRQPTPAERSAAVERHVQPTGEQMQHENAAARNPQLLAKNNGGRPGVAATARPGDFSARSAVPARAAGGRVEPAALNASARSMPAAARNASAPAPRPGGNVPRPATPAANNSRSVPRPPSANNASSQNLNRGQTAQRPAASNNSARSFNNNVRTAPQTNAARNQPQARSTTPARPSAPPAHASAPSHSNAPAKEENSHERR